MFILGPIIFIGFIFATIGLIGVLGGALVGLLSEEEKKEDSNEANDI